MPKESKDEHVALAEVDSTAFDLVAALRRVAARLPAQPRRAFCKRCVADGARARMRVSCWRPPSRAVVCACVARPLVVNACVARHRHRPCAHVVSLHFVAACVGKRILFRVRLRVCSGGSLSEVGQIRRSEDETAFRSNFDALASDFDGCICGIASSARSARDL